MLFEWRRPDMLPGLGPNELQLWQIDLNDTAGHIHLYKGHLSTSEVERSERLRVGQVRDQFVVARACVRILLGNFFSMASWDVPLTLTTFGKPEITLVAPGPLYFNVAHSREMILIALCRSSQVGVDLEYIDRNTDALELARSAFAPNEIRQIEQTFERTARQRAFFHGWTRKEAVLKADGRGLSLPLSSFEVPILEAACGTPVLIPAPAEESDSGHEWFVTDISIDVGIAAAFATAIRQPDISGFKFPVGLLSSSLMP